MAFEDNVFVNCPFDGEYFSLLRPLLFTVIYLGFNPRIALESLDSGRPRIDKILRLVRDSKYAIHDLSRLQAIRKGELYRLNMPFELGLDVGCRSYKKGRWSRKKCLILETKKYRYQAAISDISNSDIAVHGNVPRNVVVAVRNWLKSQTRTTGVGPALIWNEFIEFTSDVHDGLADSGFSPKDAEKLPIDELMKHMKKWVAKRRH